MFYHSNHPLRSPDKMSSLCRRVLALLVKRILWSSLCNKYKNIHTHAWQYQQRHHMAWKPLKKTCKIAHSGAVRHHLLFLTYNSVETSTCKYKPSSLKWTGATFISKLWGICEFLMGRIFSRKQHRQHQRTSGVSRSQTRLHSFLHFKANGRFRNDFT